MLRKETRNNSGLLNHSQVKKYYQINGKSKLDLTVQNCLFASHKLMTLL